MPDSSKKQQEDFQNDASHLKIEYEMYRNKIIELLKEPEAARKAAMLIEKMLKSPQ